MIFKVPYNPNHSMVYLRVIFPFITKKKERRKKKKRTEASIPSKMDNLHSYNLWSKVVAMEGKVVAMEVDSQ